MKEPLCFDVAVPEPFCDGRLLIMPGEWVQVEARQREPFIEKHCRGKRILMTSDDFPEQLASLMRDMLSPQTLPLWLLGERVEVAK